MEIKKVFYKKLVTGNNYSNQEIGAEAEVGMGTPENAIVDLIFWVNEQFRTIGIPQQSLQEVEQEVFRNQQELNTLNREIDRLNERIKKAFDFLKKHGVQLPDDEIPF